MADSARNENKAELQIRMYTAKTSDRNHNNGDTVCSVSMVPRRQGTQSVHWLMDKTWWM